MRKRLQDMHQLQELVRLHRLGHGPVAVARRVGLARKTERKYRRLFELAELLDGPADDLPELRALREAIGQSPEAPSQEQSSVADLTQDVLDGIGKGLGPTAIHQMLREQNGRYCGSLSALKRLCKRLRGEQTLAHFGGAAERLHTTSIIGRRPGGPRCGVVRASWPAPDTEILLESGTEALTCVLKRGYTLHAVPLDDPLRSLWRGPRLRLLQSSEDAAGRRRTKHDRPQLHRAPTARTAPPVLREHTPQNPGPRHPARPR